MVDDVAVRYLRVRKAFCPAFAAERAEVLFLMNLTGVAQVYAMPRGGGWPDLLTDGPERVTRVAAAPTGRWVVFAQDQGGNEHDRLWAMWEDGTHRFPLTPDDGAIYRFGAFRHDGQAIAYSANRRHPADFDIYLQEIQPGSQPILLWSGQGDWRVEAFYPQDEALLLSHHRSLWDVDLYRLDLAGQGQGLQWLTPHQGQARFCSPVFGARRLYCLTDFERDFLGVAALDPAGEGLEWIEAPDADVELLAASPDGQRFAWAVNRQGFSEVFLYEVATRRKVLVEGFGPGVVTALTFSPDGLWVAAEFQAANYNPNVWLFSADHGFARPLTRAPWCGVDPDQLVTPRLCTIHSGDGLDFTAWLYRPSPSRAKLPVVIAFHGGPEWQERPFFSALYQTLCEAGYAVLAPNVRGSTGYGKHFAALDDGRRRLDVLRDVAAVVDFVERQPDLDAGRMVAMGASYGGYLVLLTLTHLPDRFRAGIEMVGMADLEAFLERTGPWRRALREAEYGRLETDREVLRALSPIHAIDQIRVPLMVVHGANDPRVPVAEAEQIVAALKTRGQRVEYLCYGDEGHGIARLKNLYDLYPRLLRFLKEAIGA